MQKKDTISSEVFEKFPEFIRGVVVVKEIKNSEKNFKLEALLKQQQNAVYNKNKGLRNISSDPCINNWRQAHIKLGSNPNQYPPSIESLVKRVGQGKDIPFINTIVALFNYTSLKHMIPCGGDDLDRIKGDLLLTMADGTEEFIPLGMTKKECPIPGEVVYLDTETKKVMCRKWNWRNGDATKILATTKNIAINLDGLPPVSKSLIEEATKELSQLIKKYCGGEVVYYFLDINNPSIEI